MSGDPLIGILIDWLQVWAVLWLIYAVLLFAIDLLLTRWRQARTPRRAHQTELVRIDRQAMESMQLIGSAFAQTQELIRRQMPTRREYRS